MTTLDLSKTYLCLSPEGAVSTIEVTPQFWQTINERKELQEGRLVALFHFDTDWAHWEAHPNGEEVLVLLSGALDLIVDDGSEERVVELHEGRAFVVPRGVWHRAIVRVPSTLLGITYGRGTQHRPR